MNWKKRGVCILCAAVLLALLSSPGWAQEPFSFSEITIIPLTSNIFRCTGSITNETGEYFQGACFNLHIMDLNGQETQTMMFCLDRINPGAVLDFVQDFESENQNFQTEITFLTSY